MSSTLTLEEACKMVTKWEKRVMRMYKNNDAEAYGDEHDSLFKEMKEAAAAIRLYTTPFSLIDYVRPSLKAAAGPTGIIPFDAFRTQMELAMELMEEHAEGDGKKAEDVKDVKEVAIGAESKRKTKSAANKGPGKQKSTTPAVPVGADDPPVDNSNAAAATSKATKKKAAAAMVPGATTARPMSKQTQMTVEITQQKPKPRQGEPSARKATKPATNAKSRAKPTDTAARAKPQAGAAGKHSRTASEPAKQDPVGARKVAKKIKSDEFVVDSNDEEPAVPSVDKKGKGKRVEESESDDDDGEDEDEDEPEMVRDVKDYPLLEANSRRKGPRADDPEPPADGSYIEVEAKCTTCARNRIPCHFKKTKVSARGTGKPPACFMCQYRKVKCRFPNSVEESAAIPFGLDTPLGALGDALVAASGPSDDLPAPGIPGEDLPIPTTLGELLVSIFKATRELKEENRELHRELRAVNTHLNSMTAYQVKDLNAVMTALEELGAKWHRSMTPPPHRARTPIPDLTRQATPRARPVPAGVGEATPKARASPRDVTEAQRAPSAPAAAKQQERPATANQPPPTEATSTHERPILASVIRSVPKIAARSASAQRDDMAEGAIPAGTDGARQPSPSGTEDETVADDVPAASTADPEGPAVGNRTRSRARSSKAVDDNNGPTGKKRKAPDSKGDEDASDADGTHDATPTEAEGPHIEPEEASEADGDEPPAKKRRAAGKRGVMRK